FFGAEWHVAEAETAEQALAMATAEPGYEIVVMDEIFSQEPSALRGSRAISPKMPWRVWRGIFSIIATSFPPMTR
ncbi:MAG: hypothetical protein VXW20_07610, partial [Pseudomonadota bacterium]|nr:hypothetical protein [Pseudomonadota bacterium]